MSAASYLLPLSLSLAVLAPLPAEKDYTNIPPDAAVVARELAAAKLTLAQAVEAACKDADGLARSAQMRSAPDGKQLVDVQVYGGGKAWSCVVDATSGAVTKTEIPPFSFPGDAITGEWTT